MPAGVRTVEIDPFSEAPLARPPMCIIQAGKLKSRQLAEAVVAGCGGGAIVYGDQPSIREEYTPVVIGLHPTTAATLKMIRAAERPFVYIDNGYFKPYKEGGYFRATTNALQWAHRPVADVERAKQRYAALGLPEPPQGRDEDGHVLVALQSRTWFEMLGLNRDEWTAAVVAEVARHTVRPVAVREKPVKGVNVAPLEDDLDAAHSVVSFSSTVLLHAADRSIPIFPLAFGAASPLGTSDLSQIEAPIAPLPPIELKQSVFEALAAAQWTIEEIAAGIMWADLARAYQPEFQPLA